MLKRRGASEIVVIDKDDNTPENIARHSDAEIVVNATPIGMYPANEGTPVDITLFKNCSGVADVVYNPARTNIICDAEALGINCISGLTMLVAQAKRACEIFLGKEIDDSVIPEITEKIKKGEENIVLIGMPGCGKSTLGKLAAEKLGRPLVDTDEEIVKLAGKSIPAIFAEDGEDAFRDIESQVAENVGKMSGVVIATGGGIIKREKNYRPLHRNGKLVFLHRDINELDTDGRPLSQRDGVEKLYRERLPLYRKYADCEIAVEKDPEETYKHLEDALGLK